MEAYKTILPCSKAYTTQVCDKILYICFAFMEYKVEEDLTGYYLDKKAFRQGIGTNWSLVRMLQLSFNK